MKKRRLSVRPAWLALLGSAGLAACGPAPPEPVEIRFEARFGDRLAGCSTSYENVGLAGSTVQIGDARFYVANFRLIRPDGSEAPLQLDAGSPWQSGGLALLDFENGEGRCAEAGTAEMRQVVSGQAAAGPFAGIRFEIGVPPEQNHLDATTAPPPLNLNAMYWSWQAGHIFAKVDYWLPDAAARLEPTADAGAPRPNVAYLAHLGSTGCVSSAPVVSPPAPCGRSNRVTVDLPRFDPRSQVVVLDLGELVRGIDVSRSVPRPPGCMSGPDDPDCPAFFANLGLDLASGQPRPGAAPTFIRADSPLAAPAAGR